MKTYNPSMIERARGMRRSMPVAEMRLWRDCLRFLPVKFRRQRPFGRFIVDFYCPALKLVIEVDGESHFKEDALLYDQERTEYLEGLGLTVIRFTNDQILHELDGVYEKMRQYGRR